LETKIWISDYGYDETLHSFEKSARKLGVEQVDLLILHQALPSAFDRTLEAYRALETLLADGKVLSIGVVEHIKAFWTKPRWCRRSTRSNVTLTSPSERCRTLAPNTASSRRRGHRSAASPFTAMAITPAPRRRDHWRHRHRAREEPGSDDAPMGSATQAFGHSEVHETQPHSGEHRCLRLRNVRRRDDRD
jgi:hypothetical protein